MNSVTASCCFAKSTAQEEVQEVTKMTAWSCKSKYLNREARTTKTGRGFGITARNDEKDHATISIGVRKLVISESLLCNAVTDSRSDNY